jgi:hypothetical protein
MGLVIHRVIHKPGLLLLPYYTRQCRKPFQNNPPPSLHPERFGFGPQRAACPASGRHPSHVGSFWKLVSGMPWPEPRYNPAALPASRPTSLNRPHHHPQSHPRAFIAAAAPYPLSHFGTPPAASALPQAPTPTPKPEQTASSRNYPPHPPHRAQYLHHGNRR